MTRIVSYEKSRGLHLAEPGLMAGSRNLGEVYMTFKKLAIDRNIVLFNKGTALFKYC